MAPLAFSEDTLYLGMYKNIKVNRSPMCQLKLVGHHTFWSCCSSWTDIFHHLQLTENKQTNKQKNKSDLNMLVCRTTDHENSSWCWSEPMSAIGINAFNVNGILQSYVKETVVKFSTKARVKNKKERWCSQGSHTPSTTFFNNHHAQSFHWWSSIQILGI